jgi:hypothetical protein
VKTSVVCEVLLCKKPVWYVVYEKEFNYGKYKEGIMKAYLLFWSKLAKY